MLEVYQIGGKDHTFGISPGIPLLKPTSRITYLVRKLVNSPDNTFTPYYVIRTTVALEEIPFTLLKLHRAMMVGRVPIFAKCIKFKELKTCEEDGKRVNYIAAGIR